MIKINTIKSNKITRCSSIDQIRTKAQEWRNDLKSNLQQFRLFYNFVFDYLKEDKKALLSEVKIIFKQT